MMIANRESFAVAARKRLPYAKEVQYLESSSSSYGMPHIRLGITNINTKLSADVTLRSKNASLHDKWAFGDYGTNNNYNFLFGQQSGYMRIMLGTGSASYAITCSTSNTNDHRVRVNRDGGSWFDDTQVRSGNVFCTATGVSHEIRLFGGHQSHSPNGTSYNLPCRIYSRQCRFWYDDVLVRDMLCVVDYNGVACMYDRANGVFYYGINGTFIVGPDVN